MRPQRERGKRTTDERSRNSDGDRRSKPSIVSPNDEQSSYHKSDDGSPAEREQDDNEFRNERDLSDSRPQHIRALEGALSGIGTPVLDAHRAQGSQPERPKNRRAIT